MLQHDEYLQWSSRRELRLVGEWEWDFARLKHRVLDFSSSGSLRQLHGEFDDNDDDGSHMFEQLSGGRDCYPAASVYD